MRKRNYGNRSYHSIFLIITEGTTTEPSYFNNIIKEILKDTRIAIEVYKHKKSRNSPKALLKMARENRDSPPCETWPKKCGCTTVYRLIEKLFDSEKTC